MAPHPSQRNLPPVSSCAGLTLEGASGFDIFECHDVNPSNSKGIVEHPQGPFATPLSHLAAQGRGVGVQQASLPLGAQQFRRIARPPMLPSLPSQAAREAGVSLTALA